MYISEKKYFVEVHAILHQDVDFTEKDLVPNMIVGGRLMELSSAARSEIAFKKGYMSMQWAGHYNPKSKTVECTFRNPMYVDEDNNTIIRR